VDSDKPCVVLLGQRHGFEDNESYCYDSPNHYLLAAVLASSVVEPERMLLKEVRQKEKGIGSFPYFIAIVRTCHGRLWSGW
jgi:hypothetical protein